MDPSPITTRVPPNEDPQSENTGLFLDPSRVSVLFPFFQRQLIFFLPSLSFPPVRSDCPMFFFRGESPPERGPSIFTFSPLFAFPLFLTPFPLSSYFSGYFPRSGVWAVCFRCGPTLSSSDLGHRRMARCSPPGQARCFSLPLFAYQPSLYLSFFPFFSLSYGRSSPL